MIFKKLKRLIAIFLSVFLPMFSCIDVSLMPKGTSGEIVEEDVIKLSSDDIVLDLNGTAQINVIDAEEINYYWYSGNSSIICAISEGKTCNIMGVGVGETYVKVKDDSDRESICLVTVSNYSELEVISTSETLGNQDEYVSVKSISISDKTITLSPNETRVLSFSISPSKAIRYNDVYFVSTDPSIAEIYEGGSIYAKSIGFATIEVTCGGVSASCDVIVSKSESELVERIDGINPSLTISGKKIQQFTYSIYPENLSNVNIEVKSSNDEIIQVALYKMLNKIVFTSLSPGSSIVSIKCGDYVKYLPFTVKEVMLTDFKVKVTDQYLQYNKDLVLYELKFEVEFTLFPADVLGVDFKVTGGTYFPEYLKKYQQMMSRNYTIADDGSTKWNTDMVSRDRYYYTTFARADKETFKKCGGSVPIVFKGRNGYYKNKVLHYPYPEVEVTYNVNISHLSI